MLAPGTKASFTSKFKTQGLTDIACTIVRALDPEMTAGEEAYRCRDNGGGCFSAFRDELTTDKDLSAIEAEIRAALNL